METFFNEVLKTYEQFRGIEKTKDEWEFWDVIVLTAVDDDQKTVYEKQLEYKLARRELPLGVPFFVVADPPGPKLGNGGSTLESLQFLFKRYGDKLYDLRVLLIHAGGQSQRMPSASVLGKIFSPIPRGDKSMYQMLDIKLAMYCPLIPKMGPGVFVTCADDFLVYTLGRSHEHIKFASEGFTALAHPSSLAVGTGHGVYILKDVDKIEPLANLQVSECLQVLQKPSELLMCQKGAVLSKENISFAHGVTVKGKVTYTDSSFFFAHNVTKKFLKFIEEEGQLTCEIDAYGDFLQALGPNANSEYTSNVSNVSCVTPDLLSTRLKVFEILRGTELTLLVMNASKFVHIGTTKEYITHFCCDSQFQSEMGLEKDVFNLWLQDKGLSNLRSGDNEECPVPAKTMRLSDISLGCVMHSILSMDSCIARTAVVEFCNFNIPIKVGQNCILSNCEYICNAIVKTEASTVGDAVPGDLASLQIPHNLFIHTIPILSERSTKYVTVFFDIKDNLKTVALENDLKRLPFLGKTVEDYATVLAITLSNISPDEQYKVNLWSANLFPVIDSMSQSLALTLRCINALKTDNTKQVSLATTGLVSMATVVKQKDLAAMLKQRNELYTKIKEGVDAKPSNKYVHARPNFVIGGDTF